MNTKQIVRHIAILFSLGVAASANAQLLGGGSLGGMAGGAGIGAQIGGMGAIGGRASQIDAMRSSTRAIDVGSRRRSADIAESGRGSSAAGSASGSIGIDGSFSGTGREVLGGVRSAGEQVLEGARVAARAAGQAGAAARSVHVENSLSIGSSVNGASGSAGGSDGDAATRAPN